MSTRPESDEEEEATRDTPGGPLKLHSVRPGTETNPSIAADDHYLLIVDWPDREDPAPLYWRLLDQRGERPPYETRAFLEVRVHSRTRQLRSLTVVTYFGALDPISATPSVPVEDGVPIFDVSGFPDLGWSGITFNGPMRIELGQDLCRLAIQPDRWDAIRRRVRYGDRVQLLVDNESQVVALDFLNISRDETERCRGTWEWLQTVGPGLNYRVSGRADAPRDQV